MGERGLETSPSLEFPVARRSQHVLQSPFHCETNASQIAVSWGRAGAAQGYQNARLPGAVCDSRGSAHVALGGIWLLLLPNRCEEGRGHCLGDELDTPGKRNPVLEECLRCLYVRLRWQRNDIVTASKGTPCKWRWGVCLVGTETRTVPMDHVLERHPGQKVHV